MLLYAVLGGLGIKRCENSKRKKIKMGTRFFMQASDCIINYFNQNNFLLPCLQYMILSCTLTSKHAIFICLGEIFFLSCKVDKPTFFSPGGV